MRAMRIASGTKYVPKELFDIWGRKDPVALFEKVFAGRGRTDEDFDWERTGAY